MPFKENEKKIEGKVAVQLTWYVFEMKLTKRLILRVQSET
jgi:hypothetical protein